MSGVGGGISESEGEGGGEAAVDRRSPSTAVPAVPLPVAGEEQEQQPHRERHDGWTAVKRAQFLAALEETGCVTAAASVVKLSSTSAYRHKRCAPAFGKAWDMALLRAKANVEAMAYERLVKGSKRVRMKDGEELWTEYRQSDSLLALMLKARVLGAASPGHGGGGAAAAGGEPVVDAGGMVTVTVRMLPEEAEWYLSDEYSEMLARGEVCEWARMTPMQREYATVEAIRDRLEVIERRRAEG